MSDDLIVGAGASVLSVGNETPQLFVRTEAELTGDVSELVTCAICQRRVPRSHDFLRCDVVDRERLSRENWRSYTDVERSRFAAPFVPRYLEGTGRCPMNAYQVASRLAAEAGVLDFSAARDTAEGRDLLLSSQLTRSSAGPIPRDAKADRRAQLHARDRLVRHWSHAGASAHVAAVLAPALDRGGQPQVDGHDLLARNMSGGDSNRHVDAAHRLLAKHHLGADHDLIRLHADKPNMDSVREALGVDHYARMTGPVATGKGPLPRSTVKSGHATHTYEASPRVPARA